MLNYKKLIGYSILLTSTFTYSGAFANESSNEFISANCQNKDISTYNLVAQSLEMDSSLSLEEIIAQLRLCGGSNGAGEMIEQAKDAYADITNTTNSSEVTYTAGQQTIVADEVVGNTEEQTTATTEMVIVQASTESDPIYYREVQPTVAYVSLRSSRIYQTPSAGGPGLSFIVLPPISDN
ncbi:MAG: hypothetical protein KAI02_03590 [Gammaproteobacteria bacterium]|nr:hypothetical protein [Gammaproteobacteria bacterium]